MDLTEQQDEEYAVALAVDQKINELNLLLNEPDAIGLAIQFACELVQHGTSWHHASICETVQRTICLYNSSPEHHRANLLRLFECCPDSKICDAVKQMISMLDQTVGSAEFRKNVVTMQQELKPVGYFDVDAALHLSEELERVAALSTVDVQQLEKEEKDRKRQAAYAKRYNF